VTRDDGKARLLPAPAARGNATWRWRWQRRAAGRGQGAQRRSDGRRTWMRLRRIARLPDV